MTIAPVSWRLTRSDPDGFARALGASFERTGFAVICDHPIAAPVIEAEATRDLRVRLEGAHGVVEQLAPAPGMSGTPPRWERRRD